MKKTFYGVSIFALGLFNAQKVDVKVSYGAPSLFGISESITGDVLNIFTNLSTSYESDGVFAVEIMLHSDSKKWQYGVAYSNEKVTSDYNSLKGNFNTFLAQASYTWTNPEKKFKLYSGVGAGVMTTSFDYGIFENKDTIFAYNLSPIGVRYGQRFGVFLETNVGTKGLLQGGVSYIF